MDSETNSHKRKSPDEESDEEKHEKRPRLDNTNQKHGEVLRNNDGTSLFEAETPICNEIDDGKLNQTEQEVSDSSISVTGSENEKENAIFINMPAKSEAFSLANIEIERKDGAHAIDSIDRSDSSEDLKDDGVRDFDVSCSSSTIYETKNDDEPNGRDTQTEDDDLGIESDAEKGDDIKFDNIDHVQEKEDGLDNCVDHQIENNLEEKSYMNKELIYSRELEESEVQIEHRDVLDANLVEHECTDSVSTTESENPIVDCETSGQKDNTIDEERFLYRLLKPGESYNHGIRPKNVKSNTTIDYHVAYGSGDFVESKYISCSKTRSGINRVASFIRRDSRSQLRYIVRIDKTKLGDDCKIYDLTEELVRTEHLHSDPARRHSLRFDEVLLAPSYEIPVECFTKVATVQHGEKNWNDDA